MVEQEEERTAEDYLKRYPRICSHIICESLGYATPLRAAQILKDAAEGRENWCEWIFSCYGRDPKIAVNDAIKRRKYHRGYMAEYELAKQIVAEVRDGGEGPVFGSWF